MLSRAPDRGRLGFSPVVLGRDQDRVLAGGRYKGAFAIPVVAVAAGGMGAEFKVRGDKRRPSGPTWNYPSERETHLLASFEYVGDLVEAKSKRPPTSIAVCACDRSTHNVPNSAIASPDSLGDGNVEVLSIPLSIGHSRVDLYNCCRHSAAARTFATAQQDGKENKGSY